MVSVSASGSEERFVTAARTQYQVARLAHRAFAAACGGDVVNACADIRMCICRGAGEAGFAQNGQIRPVVAHIPDGIDRQAGFGE
jgi:hypothetical protein